MEHLSQNYTLYSSSQNLLRHSLPWTIAFITLHVVIFVSGLIGNSLVVLVIYRKTEIRSVSAVFTFNLAVADLLEILICIPANLAATIFTPWLLGSFLCTGLSYFQHASMFASAYSLVAISVDRCHGLYHPMRRGQNLSNRNVILLICAIWLTAAGATLPSVFTFRLVQEEDSRIMSSFCVELWENDAEEKYFHLMCDVIGCCGLPLILISLANLLIWGKVSHRQLPENSASTSSIAHLHLKTKRKVARVLSVVTLAFVFTRLPLLIVITRVKILSAIPFGDTETSFLNVFIPIAHLLELLNSTVNPLIYGCLNSGFRKMVRAPKCRTLSLPKAGRIAKGNKLDKRLGKGKGDTRAMALTPSYSNNASSLPCITKSFRVQNPASHLLSPSGGKLKRSHTFAYGHVTFADV